MIKRKDNKGRVLNDGEIQRSDGRYCYQYTDAFGKRKSVYSWRLTPSDKTPKRKKKKSIMQITVLFHAEIQRFWNLISAGYSGCK